MTTQRPLKLMIYDRTCEGPRALGIRWPGLTTAWKTGKGLYKSLGRIDHARGVASWAEALEWLASIEPERTIGEIQYWGHGLWGRVMLDIELLDASALVPGHKHYDALVRVRSRMSGPEALWWFRTCETFGTSRGHDFARAWTDFFGCRAAGHTYVIGFWQSGLHALSPGAPIAWSATEGLPAGQPEAPSGMDSGPRQPNTITCMRGDIPNGY